MFILINYGLPKIWIIVWSTDPESETRSSTVYVPRDECFSEIKQMTFSSKAVYSVLHAVVPALQTAIIDSSLGFPFFSSIDDLYNEGVNLPPLANKGINTILPRLIKAIKDVESDLLRFETPSTMDSEFKSSLIQFIR